MKALDPWLWKIWPKVRNLVQDRCRWKIGDVTTVRVWKDNWLSAAYLPKSIAREGVQNNELKVSDIRSKNREGWNNDLLEKFCEEDVGLVKGIPMS